MSDEPAEIVGYQSMDIMRWEFEHLFMWTTVWWADGGWDYDIKMALTDDPTVVAEVAGDFGGTER